TLAAGALFGFWQGLLIVSFASTIGATLAFLASRYLLRDWVRERLGARQERRTPARSRKVGCAADSDARP
ncbi:VTT domain-containing protein, partial [Aestuariivirga sp.]|uniref:VTT domain-containing protein n=1 Tax=Aestuariivirga sp. TaxID=2650926 RepID=UPI00359464C4